MKELFIIRDYETGEIIDIYLTDNATKCEDIFSKLERKYIDKYYDEDLHPLNSGIFEETCKKKGVKIELANRVVSYDF